MRLLQEALCGIQLLNHSEGVSMRWVSPVDRQIGNIDNVARVKLAQSFLWKGCQAHVKRVIPTGPLNGFFFLLVKLHAAPLRRPQSTPRSLFPQAKTATNAPRS